MIFYDLEVFKYDWLGVFIDTDAKKERVIINDRETIKSLYDDNVKNIWVGFNNIHYDQYIIKSILLEIDPKYVNDQIVKEGKDGWQITNKFNKIPMINYDTFISRERGLKTLEGFMGSDIRETDVDFDIDRPLTEEEIEQTVKYCRHDVEQTIEVFLKQINEFESAMGLIKMFPDSLSMSDLNRTKAQMSAKILECERVHGRDDEFDVFVLDCIELDKYASAKKFFLDPGNHWYKNGTKKCEYKIEAGGIIHTLGWGGIHAAREKYYNSGKGRILLHVDVASFYPRLMIFWDLLTRNSNNPRKFREIFERRLQLKKEGKKAEQAPLKIVINSTYGACKDKYSAAYDPRQANLICMNGQLMILDLIEHLEQIPGFELIQSNTDGLIISIPEDDVLFERVDDICYEWEKRCRMELEFDEIEWICQKDVNNYVFKFKDGGLERKGSYVKELSPLDYDLPIVNEAVVNYIAGKKPVKDTINECDELIKFQKVVKLSRKYDFVFHNDRKYNYKCYRVFASNDSCDGAIYKCRANNNPAKFGNTPDKCFIDNSSMENKKVPKNLDRNWYISLAEKRIKDFGM